MVQLKHIGHLKNKIKRKSFGYVNFNFQCRLPLSICQQWG